MYHSIEACANKFKIMYTVQIVYSTNKQNENFIKIIYKLIDLAYSNCVSKNLYWCSSMYCMFMATPPKEQTNKALARPPLHKGIEA